MEFDQYDTVDATKFLGANAPVDSSQHPLNVNQIGVPQRPAVVSTTPTNVFLNGQSIVDTMDEDNDGDTTEFIYTAGKGFLGLDASPNEAYDAPDFQNMFLSGFDSNENVIPSFHRDSLYDCLLYTSPSPRDGLLSRMPSSA